MEKEIRQQMRDMLIASLENDEALRKIGMSEDEKLEEEIMRILAEVDDKIRDKILSALSLEKAMSHDIFCSVRENGKLDRVRVNQIELNRAMLGTKYYEQFQYFNQYHYLKKVKPLEQRKEKC